MVVTIAVRLPLDVGRVVNVTVSVVAVADVTDPTAPLLKTIVLRDGVGSKAKPVIVSTLAFAAKAVLLTSIDATTVPTLTEFPLLTALVVTTADRPPTFVGRVESDTESAVAVADVTMPTAPLLNTTVLLPAVVSKPTPMIVSVLELAERMFPSFARTTGATDAI